MSYEVIPRPIKGPHKAWQYDYRLIESTAQSGRAVRIPIDGRSVERMSKTIHQWLANHGYQMRSKRDGDSLIVWAVKP